MRQPPTPRLAWLERGDAFPPVEQALTEESGANGLLAASNSLDTAMLLSAYRQGIFPWSGPGEPLLWWSPDPRMVLWVPEFKFHRSLRQAVAKAQRAGQRLSCNTAFAEVMRACAAPRPGQAGSWITPPILQGYEALHKQGLAHSIELWQGDILVGGLYLVALGQMIYGESMFSRAPNASKICLAALVHWLTPWSSPESPIAIDCQQETSHLKSMGARPIPRDAFLRCLDQQATKPALPWDLDPPSLNMFMLTHGQSA
ncbi:MAG: leucyl/phenylalanyl-tRNA--protein transferase [Burkholderiaceae bacterium]